MGLVKKTQFLAVLIMGAGLGLSVPLYAEEGQRRIEEVVVTAEKIESTVSDTSISITAFSEEAIEDFGIQGADELVNYLPATTRDAYDIRIRGVGRNFRALGGDPGVATYYNGIYSPDFGIAASENGLYDLARVEVLRGPQGTLYGRNSIGGALNYVTNSAAYEPAGEVRVQMGAYDTKELYGMVNGTILDEVLAGRITATKRSRDGHQQGLNDSPDLDSTDDRNVAVSLLIDVRPNLSIKVRANDRMSDRAIGQYGFIDQGPAGFRGAGTDYAAYGLRQVPNGTPGSVSYTNPGNGAIISGMPVRPGMDPAATHMPNAAFGRTDVQGLYSTADKDNMRNLVNDSGGDCQWPYANTECNHSKFDHMSSSFELNWDINDDMSLTYLFGTNDFEYTFNIDIDGYDSDFSKYRQTVLEDVWNYSHELRLQANFGDRISVTSGLFSFSESRKQNYTLTNNTLRYTEAADYGDLALPTPAAFGLGGASILQVYGGFGLTQAPVTMDTPLDGEQVAGLHGGSEDLYRHRNRSFNEQVAFYTQATFELNDQFAIVAGIRYAKDDKEALERRVAYAEIALANAFSPILVGLSTIPSAVYPTNMAVSAEGFQVPGVGQNTLAYYATPAAAGGLGAMSDLALTNIAAGRAVFNGNPANPITPVCAITDASCSQTLLLQGIPYSFAWRTSDSDSWSDTNFRINLDWTPNDDTLMYFSVTTGYRAGGFALGVLDARAPSGDAGCLNLGFYVNCLKPVSYDAETVTAFEIGYKGTWLDGRAQVNASIYRYDYENYQDQIDSYDSARGASVDTVVNAGDATNQGFEVEATWLVGDYFTLGGNYSYTDTEYKESYLVTERNDLNLPNSLFQFALDENGDRIQNEVGQNEFNLDAYVRDVQGNPLKRIPKQKATIYGSYEIPTASGMWALNATYSYTGEYASSAFKRVTDLVPSRKRVDISVSWKDNADRWVARLFVDNVTDERSFRGIGISTESSNYRTTGERLYPRYWGFDVTRRFGG
ncbi:MAG: TonB-dependent receptor [Pseudomonadales bacterium]|nr:TonB-dependent receptor [Pseudomonadales bacterium]